MTRSRELAKILTDGNLTGTLDVAGIATANAGVKVDNITIDGTEIDLSSGDLTLDVAGNILLDADGGNWKLMDAGTEISRFYNDAGLNIWSVVNDTDIKFHGTDGGSTITALTLDMSAAGTAIFNSQIQAPSGAVSAPTFAFSNDTNTGMSRPTSDALNFVTGGAERVRITSAGNVGIGTTAPISKLNIAETAGGAAGIDLPISISGDRYQADYGVGIGFRPETNSASYKTKTAIIASGGGYGYNQADLHICIDADNTVGNEVGLSDAVMTFKKGGNVGIGLTAPNVKLEVAGEIRLSDPSADSHVYLRGAAGQKAKVTLNEYGVRSWELGAGTKASGVFTIDGGGVERMRINASGNMGLGTSSPEGKLTLGVNTTSSDGLYINNAASGGGELDLVSLGTSYNAHGAGAGEVWLYSPDNINIGGAAGGGNDVKILGDGGERWRMTSDGLQLQNGVGKRTYGGTVAGNATVSITINHASNVTFKIVAGANHYGIITSYGCAHEGIYANGAGGMYSLNVFNHTSGTHGSWTLTRNSATQFTVNKTAGTYAGGGYYYVSVEGSTLS